MAMMPMPVVMMAVPSPMRRIHQLRGTRSCLAGADACQHQDSNSHKQQFFHPSPPLDC
jgi:hypothetical protein